MTVKDVQFTPERWIQFWDNYKGLEHQIKANYNNPDSRSSC